MAIQDFVFPNFDLTGKVAIVTGGTKGIGYSIAVSLAKFGADVVVASRTAADCARVAEEIKTLGVRSMGIPTDVTDTAQIDALVAKTVEEFGKLDIMVCNAGGAVTAKAIDITPEQWDKVLDLDLKAVFFCATAAARQMIKQGNGGRIINIASGAGLSGAKNISPYNAAKAGVVNGYPSETEGVFVYLPQRSYSRYEFCVMLERMTGIGSELDIAEDELSPTNEPTDEMLDTEILSEDVVLTEDKLDNRKFILDFADAQSIPDWAYDSVYRLYASGMLDKIMQKDIYGNVVFNGSDFITREDVMIVIGMLCESAPEDFSTDMYSDLTDEQKSNEFINNCLYSGIFSGYEDMTVRPYNHLTRAEAATVFLRLEKYLSETEF